MLPRLRRMLLLTNAVSKDILNLDYLKDLFYKRDVDKQKSIKIIPQNIADLLSDESTIHHFQFLMGQRSLQTPNICMDLQPIKYWK